MSDLVKINVTLKPIDKNRPVEFASASAQDLRGGRLWRWIVILLRTVDDRRSPTICGRSSICLEEVGSPTSWKVSERDAQEPLLTKEIECALNKG